MVAVTASDWDLYWHIGVLIDYIVHDVVQIVCLQHQVDLFHSAALLSLLLDQSVFDESTLMVLHYANNIV